MIPLLFARRCLSVHAHHRYDTGEAIKVQCKRERGHRGAHYWGPDTWVASGDARRATKVIKALFSDEELRRLMEIEKPVRPARAGWRRNPACVERWPECADGEYNPACCRFPKVCSCDELVGEQP